MHDQARIVNSVLSGDMEKEEGQNMLTEIRSRIVSLYHSDRPYTFDSPIEEAMYKTLAKYIYEIEMIADNVQIYPQFEIGNYRADFVILANKKDKTVQVVVECDGYDYHDRSPEQATYDRRRDRFMVIAGYVVLRFSGQEINENVEACVGDVIKAIRSLFQADIVKGLPA